MPNPSRYSPDALSSGAATQKPFQEAGVPKANTGIVTSLLRLAMRRLAAHGMGATKETRGVMPASNAFTMGSHGNANPVGSFHV